MRWCATSGWPVSSRVTSISEVFPEQGEDDSDLGWGSAPEPVESDSDRLSQDRPPHHERGW